MQLIDYTGRLNTHGDYMNMLEKLKKRTKYIEVVVIDQKESNHIVDRFFKDVISIKKVSEWWGTKTLYFNNLFRIKSSDALFEYLGQFETFCKCYTEYDEESQMNLLVQKEADFGWDDIAFFDDNELPLLCTTTHESFISIRDDL